MLLSAKSSMPISGALSLLTLSVSSRACLIAAIALSGSLLYAIPTVSQLRTGLKEVKSKVVESDPSAAMPQIRMMLAIVNLSLAGEEPVAICFAVRFFCSDFLGDWSDTNIAYSACDHFFDHAGQCVRDEIYFRFKIVALF
jgi:hypothetical protein